MKKKSEMDQPKQIKSSSDDFSFQTSQFYWIDLDWF